jgi:uncharacterized protein (TIGR00255 family)
MREPGGAGVNVNHAMLAAWIRAFRDAARTHGIPGEPDLNAALRVPGMIEERMPEELGSGFEAALAGAAAEAITLLNEARAREGADTAAVLRRHCEKIAAAAVELENLRGEVSFHLQTRLHEKLNEVFRLTNADPSRITQEVAMLTERSDVSEEIARLKIHAQRLTEILNGGGETGKRLEFLAQEMQRETNTVLSKSMNAGEPGRRITEIGLELKAEVEKIREQSLNLE